MKKERSLGPISSHLKGRLLIDGKPPRNPNPELVAMRSKSQYTTGRQRSTDMKGLLTEIIEDIYPPLTCPICYELTSTRADGENHVKQAHRGEKPYCCLADCDQTYSSRGGLRYHLLNVHAVRQVHGEKKETRPKSPPAKKARLSKKVLPKSATGEEPMDEDSIANSPKQEIKKDGRGGFSKALEDELDQVYPVVVCPACKENFDKKTHVIRHLVQNHKGEVPYVCFVPDCKRSKSYATREGLIYHLVNYHN